MKKKLAVGLMLVLMAPGAARDAAASATIVVAPNAKEDAPRWRANMTSGSHPSICATPNLIRNVAGGDPLANLRDAHKDPRRCKLSICIPASINLDVVCELTNARDSEGRYNCRMVINDFLRHCTESCHTGDWSWLDSYRGPY
ncbi:hypothetical protein [Massilia sp. CCM 8734]|uniref:hypothetical protein n=1 Tax=Massilia sp. CCM 8734 TaxID=2609283 RepID=UPI001420ED83|nr:hypothetical protein [Massilia sp. CCM 8734]NHZ96963.1 hypothetical protein [Massilia sp. CCM 8734]